MLRSRKSFAFGNQTQNQWENDTTQAANFRSFLQNVCSKNNLIISQEKPRENGIEFLVKHTDANQYADIRIYNAIKTQYNNLTVVRLPNEMDSLFFSYKKKGPEIKKAEAFFEIAKLPVLLIIIVVSIYTLYVLF